MQIKCPYCQTAIDVATSGQYTCGQCRAIFRVDLGDAAPAAGGAPATPASGAPSSESPTLAAPAASAPAASSALAPIAAAPAAALARPPAGARCAKHPDTDAASICGRCGSFSCALCTVPLAQGPHCPACAERARASGRATPWDRRKELGWYPAAKETVRRVLFQPADFFRDMPREGGFENPITFLMLMTLVQLIFTLLFIWGAGIVGFIAAGGAGRGNSGEAIGMIVGQLFAQSLWQICMTPISAIMTAFVSGAVIHVCLMIVGGAKNGFEATVRVVCYASSAQLLMLAIIPLAIVGGILGAAVGVGTSTPEAGIAIAGIIVGIGMIAIVVRTYAIQVIGLREAHETTTGRALGALLLPLAALLCCFGGLGAMIALGASR